MDIALTKSAASNGPRFAKAQKGQHERRMASLVDWSINSWVAARRMLSRMAWLYFQHRLCSFFCPHTVRGCSDIVIRETADGHFDSRLSVCSGASTIWREDGQLSVGIWGVV
ncbi:hypothetical protein RvY_09744-2 [Ramazzottius varieornatus]|uniref:Uncharacterized protein n=1 Tax=Ramazzottius varieornatus TaxID=947166 RepID=A0A1D1VI84_RAMVA|nr:hypothetical protein RvY_09744-2 [Ramazzottius varieornatus]